MSKRTRSNAKPLSPVKPKAISDPFAGSSYRVTGAHVALSVDVYDDKGRAGPPQFTNPPIEIKAFEITPELEKLILSKIRLPRGFVGK